jgi:hypothetical protein
VRHAALLVSPLSTNDPQAALPPLGRAACLPLQNHDGEVALEGLAIGDVVDLGPPQPVRAPNRSLGRRPTSRRHARRGRPGGGPPLRSVRRCSAVRAVATGYCYRLRTEWAGLGHKNGQFTLRIVAERQGFEPWDLPVSGFQDRRNRPLCHLSAVGAARFWLIGPPAANSARPRLSRRHPRAAAAPAPRTARRVAGS